VGIGVGSQAAGVGATGVSWISKELCWFGWQAVRNPRIGKARQINLINSFFDLIRRIF
jgi:uncharacterized Ntn-hydrolase superfamily protein